MYRDRNLRRAAAVLAWIAAWPLRAAYLLFLLAVVWDTQRYLAACRKDGLIHSLSLTAFNAQLDDDIARAETLRRVLVTVPR